MIQDSLELASKLDKSDLNYDMVYVIAAYHDVGLIKDRKTHHIHSKEFVQNDNNLKRWFTED